MRYIENQVFRPQEVEAQAPAQDLRVARNIPDQNFSSGGAAILVTIPADTFEHSNAQAIVTLTATLVDGKDLPNWLIFDSNTGTFRGVPPPTFEGELVIKVLARDEDGRQAETTIRVRVNKGDKVSLKGKPSLSAQLREHDVFSWKLERDQVIKQVRQAHRV